ncbi:MAG: DUF1700 domain-containing protein [Candidatus Wallbacteria bacterium]|nr:DUF1700 domain-containing protein [Candidatus Wallbacteria bacterium]
MKKDDFIKKLSGKLCGLPESEIKEILYDYEEHFRHGLAEGKSEEEVAENLGDPSDIGRQYQANVILREARENYSLYQICRGILALTGLGVLNLFIVLPFYLTVMGLLIGSWAVSAAFPVVGVTLMLFLFFGGSHFTTINWVSGPIWFPPEGIMGFLSGFFVSLGTITTGLLLLLFMWYITRLIYKLTVDYLQINLDIIRK